MILCQISDTHLDGSKSRYQAKQDLFSRAIDHGAGVIAWTGDLTDSGHWREFDQAHKLLEFALDRGVDVLPVPGNHDVSWMGIWLYTSKKAGLVPLGSWHTGKYPKVYHYGDQGGRIIGLDSQQGLEGRWFPPLARGRLGAEQLRELELLKPTRKDTIICHHHPIWYDQAHLLEDHREAMPVLSKAGRVLFGHKHRLGHWRINDCDFLACDNVDYLRFVL